MQLSDIVLQSETQYGAQPALIFQDETLTYTELAEGVRTLARTLRQLGIEKGDHVALLLPNCPQTVCAYFAIALMGGVVVPANPLLKAAELEYIWNDAQVRLVITVPPLVEVAKAAQANLPNIEHLLQVIPSPKLEGLTAEALAPNAEIREVGEVAAEVDPHTCAVIIYTSGTTGRPKGAMLSHFNLMRNVEMVQEFLKFDSSDRFFTVLPLFHSFAMTVCQNVALSRGCTSVLIERFVPTKVFETLLTHKITILPGAPAMFYALLQIMAQGEVKLPDLRLMVSGGAPLPAATFHALEKAFGIPVLEGDGPTECSPVTSVNPVDGVRKVGSVGIPLPGVEIAIFDEADKALPAEEVGEIVVRGDNVMLGYLNQPEETAEAMKSGWYHTGDMGKIDAEGYVYIVDRKKDMIITAGLNVYPREIEEVLFAHPAVAIAAVIGLADAVRGEEVTAVVVLKPGATATDRELISFCRERLANYKVPRKVLFREMMPMGGSGKVVKRLLKKELELEATS
jgi:long-chain acyl-CoA synthetase